MDTVKKIVKRMPLVGPLAQRIWHAMRGQRASQSFPGSATYWDSRYVAGGNSGNGSYGELAAFKATILNEFVETHAIESVIEFGCGDGNQLLLANYPRYLGFDVSPTAIDGCHELFAEDPSKSFALVGEYAGEKADLAMSLDVIYHLVEDAVYQHYLTQLFSSAERYVVVYASNYDEPASPRHPHVRHRRFTDWVARHQPEWKQIRHLPNPYPYNESDGTGTFADFYFFARR